MDHVLEAIDVMRQVGIAVRTLTPRGVEKTAFALLALADVPPGKKLTEAKDIRAWTLGTRQVIIWANDNYRDPRKDSSYDYVLRNDLDLLLRAGYVQSTGRLEGKSYNDSTRKYGLADDFSALLRQYGTTGWSAAVAAFMSGRPNVVDIPKLSVEEDMTVSGVGYQGEKVEFGLGPGGHNALIKRSVEDFLERFGHDARLLYVGDASDRYKFRDQRALSELGIDLEDVLPDVVAISAVKNWLFIIEAVHSRGPVSHSKHERFEQLLGNFKGGVVYVTTFADRSAFRKVISEIAWETEVWLADESDHLIHFNGDRFMGPHSDGSK